MSNVLLGWPIYSDVGVTYSPVLSGGSWLAALPLTNLQDRRIAKVARSVDAALTSTIVKADLGVARSVRLAALVGHNLTSAALMRVRGMTAYPILDDSAFNAWGSVGTPIVTTGQTDPFGGTRACLIADDDGAVQEQKTKTCGFTGDGTKGFGITLKPNVGTVNEYGVWDATAATWRMRFSITWAAGVPSLAIVAGAGTLYAPTLLAATGYYTCVALANGIIAANNNQFVLIPTQTAASTGSVYAYEAMAWDDTASFGVREGNINAAWPSGVTTVEAYDGYVRTALYLGLTAATMRYWRAEIADTANPSGYVQAGRLVLAGGLQPTVNMSYGCRQRWEDDSIRTVTDGGAALYQQKGQRRLFDFALNDQAEAEVLPGVFDMQAQLGLVGQVFFVFDPADTTQLHRRSALCVQRELSPLEMTSLGRYGVPVSLVEEL